MLPAATDQWRSPTRSSGIAFTDVELIGLNVRNLSLSAGMTLLELGDDLDDALQRADQALYRAKRDGRNRCAAAWENVDA